MIRCPLLAAAGVAAALVITPAFASPIVAGFNSNTLPANDDGSTGVVGLGFGANYFGTTYTQLFVNNNGNVTFNNPLSTYTPFGLTSTLGIPIIAPFFADVDTRGAGSGLLTYGTGTYAGDLAFGANWLNVGYYSGHTDKLDSFQLVLVDRSDVGAGDFDIYFNYGSMLWETGDASGGSGGLGGACAAAGFSNGSGAAGTNFEIAGSHVCGALIDGGADQLITATNDGVPGQFLFEVRNGVVVQPPGVPEPASLVLLGTGLVGLGLLRRRRTAS